MLRTTGLIGGMLLVFSTSCWGSIDWDAISTEGFYVGLGTGPETVFFQKNSRIISVAQNFNVTDKIQQAGKGWFGSLFGGYAMQFAAREGDRKNLYLAGEINVNTGSDKFKYSNFERVHMTLNTTTYKMGRSFGVSVLPGFLVTDDTLFYGRLAYAKRKLSIMTTDNTLVNINKYRCGFRYGVGIRQAVSERFSVRLDYSHTAYRKAKMFVAVDPVTKNTTIKPTVSQVEVGVVFDI